MKNLFNIFEKALTVLFKVTENPIIKLSFFVADCHMILSEITPLIVKGVILFLVIFGAVYEMRKSCKEAK